MKEEELLSWLIHQKRHSEIADVTDEIVDKLIDTVPYLAVLFCKYVFAASHRYNIEEVFVIRNVEIH